MSTRVDRHAAAREHAGPAPGWAATQAELSGLSPRGEQTICDSCGHFLQRDTPELVVEAIRSIVASTSK